MSESKSESKVKDVTTAIMGEITVLAPAFVILLSGLSLTGAVEMVATLQQVAFMILGAIGSVASIWYNISAGTKSVDIAGKIADTVSIVGPAIIAVFSLLNFVGVLAWIDAHMQAATAIIAFVSFMATYMYDKYAKKAE